MKRASKTGVCPRSRSRGEGRRGRFEVAIPNARLWSLDDPFLYEVEAVLQAGGQADRVNTYFGMRKISVVNLPGTNHPYIALNNRPLYLRMALDQSYHPQGFYAFPSDEFIRDEILRSRRIGLNANRLHVKIDVPRKLYWADRLGLLLMCDVPNSWGEPDAEMRQIEHASAECSGAFQSRSSAVPLEPGVVQQTGQAGLPRNTAVGRLHLPAGEARPHGWWKTYHHDPRDGYQQLAHPPARLRVAEASRPVTPTPSKWNRLRRPSPRPCR